MSPRRFVQPALFFAVLLGCLALAKIWLAPPASPILAQTAAGGDAGEAEVAHAAQIIIPGLTVANSSPTALGNPTFFTATIPAAPDSYSYSWRFGDGATASGPRVQHTYTTAGPAGKFTAEVIVERNGETDRRSTDVFIFEIPDPPTPPPPPPTNLRVVCDAGIEANNPVTCVATVEAGTDIVYTWNMGDGTEFLQGSSVTHAYQTPGPYTVQVTASNNQGSAAASTTITILDESITSLDFAPTVRLIAGEAVSFLARIERGTNVSYEWTWGDGDVVIGGHEGWHIYDHPGVYEVSVRAWNSRSQLITAKQFQIHIRPPSNLQVFNNSPQPAGSDITFNAMVTSGEAVIYTWDWGDNTSPVTTPTASIRHEYSLPGKYVLRLTATNSGGSTELMQIVYISVQPPVPEAVINWNRDLRIPGQSILFTACFKLPDEPCGNIDSFVEYRWDFGDGKPITITHRPVVEHTYQEPGRFAVSLTATGAMTKSGDAIAVMGHGVYFPAISRIGSFLSSSQPGSEPTVAATLAPTAESTATPTAIATPTPTNTRVTLVAPPASETPTATSTPAPTALPTTTPTPSGTPTATLTPTQTPGGTIPLLLD